MSQGSKRPSSIEETVRSLAGGFVRFGERGPSAPLLVPPNAEVRAFEFRDLQSDNKPTYHQTKSEFRPDLAAKSSRFALSELVANQLSVEAEEQRRFEKRVSEEVERQLSVLRKEARDKGHAEGLEVGRKEAFEAEKARLAAHMENLASATEAVKEARDVLVNAYEKQLVDVAFRLAELVVHTHIAQRPEMIYTTVAAILSRIAREEDVRIRLSASDFDAIEKIRDSLKEVSRLGRIAFDVDSSLKAGDCVVESSSGEISSFVDDSFAKLKSEMLTLISMKSTGTEG